MSEEEKLMVEAYKIIELINNLKTQAEEANNSLIKIRIKLQKVRNG